MKNVFAILRFDRSQFLTKWNMLLAIFLLVLGLGFAQYGISNFKEAQRQKIIFQEVEKSKIEQFISYRMFAAFGFRVMFMPEPMSILFTSSTVIQDMTSYIDSGERLNIYKPLKGKNIFEFSKNWFADFSGILFFFGGLVALILGFAAFQNTEYQRYLATIVPKDKLYASAFGARAIELALFFLFFIFAVIALIELNGISIGINRFLLFFFIVIYLVSMVFFAIGTLFGTCKSRLIALTGAISAFFLLLFIVPSIVNIVISINSNFIKPDYQLELEKLKLMMDFEKKSNEIAGVLKLNDQPTDIDKELALSYYKNEFQNMQALEDELKAQIDSNIKLFYRLSAFFPTTFYLGVVNELSSKGYKTLQVFYADVKRIKAAFIKKYLEKVYLTKDSTVEPFLKGDANVLTAKPSLPDHFLLGLLFCLVWIAAFSIPAYYRFKKNLFELPELEEDEDIKEPILIRIHTNNTNFFDVADDSLSTCLYNLMSADAGNAKSYQKKDAIYHFQLNQKTWDKSAGKQEFLYLCHPKEFPKSARTGSFINLQMDLMQVAKPTRAEIIKNLNLEPLLKKPIGRLSRRELGRVFLAILEMRPFAFYLFNDVGRKMPLDFAVALKDKMNELYSADRTIIFVYSGIQILRPQGRKKLGSGDSSNWESTVQSMADAVVEQS
jgi:ABC-type transport system involved in multi-copper enzyme maturation permease subunit